MNLEIINSLMVKQIDRKKTRHKNILRLASSGIYNIYGATFYCKTILKHIKTLTMELV